MRKKLGEGRLLPDTPDMKAWRKEFEKMSLSEHDNKLRQLGLGDEEIEEFNESFKETKKTKAKAWLFIFGGPAVFLYFFYFDISA